MYLDVTSPPGTAAAASLTSPLTRLAAALADGDRSPQPAPDGDPTRETDPIPVPRRAAEELVDVLCHLRDCVPGTRAASVIAASPSRRGHAEQAPTTVAATSELAEAADRCQLSAGAGPCLDARERAVQVGADQLAQRWPEVAEQLRQLGVSAVLAHPLPGLGRRGVLALYADEPFPVEAAGPAADAAAVAAVALATLETRERADNLEIALVTSRRIAAAVGIVMAHDRCSYDDAFQRIRVVSQRSHRKMRDLADRILLTGALPEVGGPPG
jgi:hypothetical protein